MYFNTGIAALREIVISVYLTEYFCSIRAETVCMLQLAMV